MLALEALCGDVMNVFEAGYAFLDAFAMRDDGSLDPARALSAAKAIEHTFNTATEARERFHYLAQVPAQTGVQRRVALALAEEYDLRPLRTSVTACHVQVELRRPDGSGPGYYVDPKGRITRGYTARTAKPVLPTVDAAVVRNRAWYRQRAGVAQGDQR